MTVVAVATGSVVTCGQTLRLSCDSFPGYVASVGTVQGNQQNDNWIRRDMQTYLPMCRPHLQSHPDLRVHVPSWLYPVWWANGSLTGRALFRPDRVGNN